MQSRIASERGLPSPPTWSYKPLESYLEQIRKLDIYCIVALFTRFHPERIGQISLSTSGSPGDKEIPVLCDIFIGCKPLNKRTVQLVSGSMINISNACIRLVAPGIAVSIKVKSRYCASRMTVQNRLEYSSEYTSTATHFPDLTVLRRNPNVFHLQLIRWAMSRIQLSGRLWHCSLPVYK